jgi:hypothetical protein
VVNHFKASDFFRPVKVQHFFPPRVNCMAADDVDDGDEGPVPTQTGVVVQLTEDTHSMSKQRTSSRRKRNKRRPIGFQLGELGHLDRPVKDE